MARKKTEATVYASQLYNLLYMKYYIIATNLFKWEGLEEIGLKPKYIEESLFKYGVCGFWKDPLNGYVALPCCQTGKRNIYNEPTEWRIYGFDYNENVSNDDMVLIPNNSAWMGLKAYVSDTVKRLVDIQQTIDVNIVQQKTPYILKCTEKQLLTLKNLMLKINTNEPFIYGDKSLDLQESIQSIDIRADFLAKDLNDYYQVLENRLLTQFGVNNSNADKKERLLVDEVNSNNQHVEIDLELMLEVRQTACEQINKKYGLNLKVSRRDFGYDQSIHNDIEGDNREQD